MEPKASRSNGAEGEPVESSRRPATQKGETSMNASEIRKGIVIIYNGAPHRVLEFQHRTPGNLRAFVQARIRNLLSGLATDVRFSSTESVDRVTLEQNKMQ